MKKLLIACSMASVCALVACADVLAQSTPKTLELAWFDVSTTATNHGDLVANGDSLCALTDSKFEIDSDLANPVVFTAADALTQQMAKVTFNLDAAIVPNGALQAFGDNAPKIAFALYESGSSTNFTAWLGSDWITLTGATVPAEGTPYTLTMEFDNRNGNKVRFSVGSVTLKYNSTAEWIDYLSAVTNAVAVNFVGCGKVASFEGKQIYIAGEIVVIDSKGVIEISNEAMAAFAETIKDTSYARVDVFLATAANVAFAGTSFQEGLTVAEAYALGLVEKDSGSGKMVAKDNGELKVRADAQASTTDGIPVNLNIEPPTDTGAAITYQLQGSADGTVYADIGAATEYKSAIKVQTSNIGTGSGKYRYFKVKTIVTLKAAQD